MVAFGLKELRWPQAVIRINRPGNEHCDGEVRRMRKPWSLRKPVFSPALYEYVLRERSCEP
jgi:hypothetical protein